MPALEHAILVAFHVGDGVGEPDADADQYGDDCDRDDVHQHAVPIVHLLAVLLVLSEGVVGFTVAVRRWVEWADRLPLNGAVATPEFQHVPELLRVVGIWLVVHHVRTTMRFALSIARLLENF